VKRYAGPRDSAAAKAVLEYKTLDMLRGSGIPAPEPLYLDASGELLGIPGIVMAQVPGRQVVSPPDFAAWARSLARMLAQVHSVAYDPPRMEFLLDGDLEAFFFLRLGVVPERMTAHPDGRTVWEAVQALAPSAKRARSVLLHGDYWPGNVLWRGGKVSAVLDWEDAARGNHRADVAYCRMDIAMRGLHGTADDFLAAYEAETGARVENLGLWELAAAVRAMPDPERWVPQWRSFGDTTTTDESVRQDLAIFIAGARTRAGL
jgi:aminoglycoside phosphotransferase (APT) family kinase protein